MNNPKETSKTIASIASRGMASPGKLTHEEIQRVCASALVQTSADGVSEDIKKGDEIASKLLTERMMQALVLSHLQIAGIYDPRRDENSEELEDTISKIVDELSTTLIGGLLSPIFKLKLGLMRETEDKE